MFCIYFSEFKINLGVYEYYSRFAKSCLYILHYMCHENHSSYIQLQDLLMWKSHFCESADLFQLIYLLICLLWNILTHSAWWLTGSTFRSEQIKYGAPSFFFFSWNTVSRPRILSWLTLVHARNNLSNSVSSCFCYYLRILLTSVFSDKFSFGGRTYVI